MQYKGIISHFFIAAFVEVVIYCLWFLVLFGSEWVVVPATIGVLGLGWFGTYREGTNDFRDRRFDWNNFNLSKIFEAAAWWIGAGVGLWIVHDLVVFSV